MKISVVFGIHLAQIPPGSVMRILRLLCTLLFSSLLLMHNAVASSVGDFALLDQNGTFHQASYYSDHDAIVILAESSETLAGERARTAVSNIESVEQSLSLIHI